MICQHYKKSFRSCLWVLLLCLLNSAAVAVEFTPTYLKEIEKKYGDYAKRRLVAWQKLTTENKTADEQKKLLEVNNFFNLLPYERDIDHWGVSDHWATPLEFVVSGAGDCEDFSVAKYFALLDLGVADDKLLLMYVKIKLHSDQFDQAHMVLLYYPTQDGTPLVLDNVNKELLAADKRNDLQPIYGFNGTGLWQAKELGKGEKIGQPSDLKRWVVLEDKMKSQKIDDWLDK